MTSAIPVIAVDGPSGTGKGTLSQRLAETLGWHLLDSGALYRVLAYAALEARLDLADAARIGEVARTLPLEFRSGAPSEGVRVVLDGADVTSAIRTEAAGNAASRVAAIPEARRGLLARQRAFRQPPGLVADGRDMGTVVFPDARLKIFMTASPEERARRRYNQLKEKGTGVSLAALSKDIAERDERDRARSISPLVPAADAQLIDTSSMAIDAVYAQVVQWVRERGLL